ncbi:unnamed protein product, partial [Aureobasidium uvarum]
TSLSRIPSSSEMLIRAVATRPAHCTKDTCPASYSIYGYAPNLGANAFFVTLFAISCLVFCYQAKLYRNWIGFSIALILGTALESIAIVLQGAGGAISAAAASGTNKQLLDLGVNVMIAGLSSQVVTLAVFAVLAGIFFLKVAGAKERLSPAAGHIWQATNFRLTIGSAVTAFILIFIRCAYRIAELKDGWGSPIMRREGEFIVLDSV